MTHHFAAGLNGTWGKCVQYFTVDEVIPAVGQAFGIETRDDGELDYLLGGFSCEESMLQPQAERAYRSSQRGCSVPIAAHAVNQR